MRYQYLLSIAALAGLLASCDGMYDTLEDYSGEVVYPDRYDTIVGHIGFERVEIDLMKAGRVPSSELHLGKAEKTVVEYDDQKIVIDSLVSWVEIDGLVDPKLYRFQIYTIDQYGNQSVPQEIALIPFTNADLETINIPTPRILSSPTSAVIDWPNGIGSTVMAYYGFSYAYTDKDGTERQGDRMESARFLAGNLEPGSNVEIQMNYRVAPIINGDTLIDQVTVENTLQVTTPTASTPFTPSEEAVLQANGVTEFTAEGVEGISKLIFPVHTNSLQDLFYFPDLREVDLTGEGLFEIPTLLYDRNGATSTVGGGNWLPMMRKVTDMQSANYQILKDLLEAGIVEKVRYIPNSMGLDDMLAPFVESGAVELVNQPDEASIPLDNYFVDGLVQSGAWRCDYEYPAADPAGSGMANVLKMTLRDRSASFALALPRDYKYNTDVYKYLRFKVYAPSKDSFTGKYIDYQRLWPRFMNYMWAFRNLSDFGQEYWAPSANDFKIADSDLEKWIEVKVDLSEAVDRHNRVIVMNVGGEPSGPYEPPVDIIYHFADFRLTKE